MSEAKQIPFQSVQKLDGRVVSFDQNRITDAVSRAMEATQEGNLSVDPRRISGVVVAELAKKFPGEYILRIEDIQDSVEEALILMDFPKTAKAYILYRSRRTEIREKTKVVPDHVRNLVNESKQYFRNSLSEFIYYRTYSRWLDEEGRRETWLETVTRYMDFMKENLGDKLTPEEYAEVKEAILKQEIMPSMRLLW